MNAGFVDVAGIDDIPDGHARIYEIDRIPVVLCRQGNEVFAVAAECTHEAFLLMALETFPTRVESGRVLVHLEED
jgi:nitrite reductase/ring-hydroxylating ferredoxin subunit